MFICILEEVDKRIREPVYNTQTPKVHSCASGLWLCWFISTGDDSNTTSDDCALPISETKALAIFSYC